MRLAADLHIHTVSSGHSYSTLGEYLVAAKAIGLEMIGIADHGPAMPGGPHYYHFSNMKTMPREINGIQVRWGSEANIINEDGKIDLDEETLKCLDFVIVALHPRCGYEKTDEANNTQALIKALNNPYIKIIAHPGNPAYPVNIEQTVKAAKEKGVAIEINNSSFTGHRVGSWERCLEFAKEIKKQNWKVMIGSDSHIATAIGRFDKALELIKLADLREENIINTSIAKIEEFLSRRTRIL